MKKKYYCKELDCNNEISYWSYKYGTGRCQSCAQKERFQNKKEREKISKKLEGHKRSEKSKKKQSISMQGEKNHRFGKNWDIKIRKKISKSHKGKKASEETKRKMSLTRGGTGTPYELTEYGAEFDNILKEQIRFRDNYTCQECGCSQIDNGKQLDVHHIDDNKFNNELNNLIALCYRCHLKTNHNRNYWKNYFKNVMEEKWIKEELL